jgi:hypothetical protein
MNHCLFEENLESLLRGRASWWRAFFWRRHLRSCAPCQSSWQRLKEDEQLLAELRVAMSVSHRPSPLSTARRARCKREP